jgi:hypothetical protein
VQLATPCARSWTQDESAATTIPGRIGIQYAAAFLQTEANQRRAFDSLEAQVRPRAKAINRSE